jgi:hypothetical protein
VNDDEAQDTDVARSYRVGARAPSDAAVALARTAADRLAGIVAQLAACEPLCVRVVPSGLVRTELFAEDAMTVAALLLPVAGTLAQGVDRPELEPVNAPGGQIDFAAIHPTWYAMRPDVDYKPGLAQAFAAREVLRDLLCAVLLRGPVAVVPTARDDGRGVVRMDLTPSDAERLCVLLEYVRDLLAQGRGGEHRS